MVKLIDEADVGAADAGALDVAQVRGGDGVDIDFAGIGMLEQAGDVQQRRFSRSRRRDQSHRLAGPDRKLGAFENVERRSRPGGNCRLIPCRNTIGWFSSGASGPLRQLRPAVDGAGSMMVVISSIARRHS